MNQEIAEDMNHAMRRIVAWVEHTSIYTLFNDIPQKNKVSYLTHVWRHAKQSIYFGYLAICFWIHAFFPFLCPSMEPLHNIPSSEKKELPNQVNTVDKSVLKPEKENLGNDTAL